MESNETTYPSEERILAALAHAAILLPYFGFLAPLGIWISHREKSTWVRFQALQAMAYQSLQFVFLLLGICLFYPIFMVVPFLQINDPDGAFIQMMFLIFSPFLFWGVLILVGLAGGVSCAFGRDFKYPILGRKLHKYLATGENTTSTGAADDRTS